MKKPPFLNNEIYHIFNRGVEKRKIFLDQQDYFRFIHDLYEFNDTAPAGKFSEVKPPIISEVKPPIRRKLIVDVICFCLMPNHFHLILRQRINNGIPLFMQKLDTGYTMYFNQRCQRVGSLFQGSFKAILVTDDNYFVHLSRYIHTNPLEIIEPNWKTEGIHNWRKTNKFLEEYRWSSYPDYIGKENFPSVTNRNLINRYFDNLTDYKKFVNEWCQNDDYIADLTLES